MKAWNKINSFMEIHQNKVYLAFGAIAVIGLAVFNILDNMREIFTLTIICG